jgi:prevent-host-death family protein
MTITGHNVTMKAKISELKARLSAFLDAVRRGQVVTILDRKTPIARIVPLDEAEDALRIEPATAKPGTIGSVRGVEVSESVDVLAILTECRGDR